VRRKYLLLLLIPLLIAFAGCRKKHFAPPPEPNAPSNLTATAVSYKQIHLSWQDNCSDEDYFRVLCPTMWGTQHQTIATLPPDTTNFDHHNLQPMTEYEYYVCVHRGEEHTCSERAYATTLQAPVEIVEYWLHRGSMCKFYLGVKLKSAATEPCLVELTAQYHITADYYEYSEWETYIYTLDLEALADNTWFEFLYIIGGTGTCGDKSVECELEITDVEIDY